MVLPDYVTATLRGGIKAFGQRLAGFDDGGALLTGVETRTSAPLRIIRGSDKQSVSHRGLYPCGEGAGYAGGIMSAALDGYHVARAVMTATMWRVPLWSVLRHYNYCLFRQSLL